MEQDKICLLVMIGVRADGHKELIALADGFGSHRSRGQTCSATAKRRDLTDDLDVLLEFYDHPAKHWVHLRTTTPSSRRSRPSGYGNASP